MSQQPLATALDINTTEASERTLNQVKLSWRPVARSECGGEDVVKLYKPGLLC